MLSLIRMMSCCSNLCCRCCLNLYCRNYCFLHLNCLKSCYFFHRMRNFYRMKKNFSKGSLYFLQQTRIVNCLSGMILPKLNFSCMSFLFLIQYYYSCSPDFRLNLPLPLKRDGGKLFRFFLFVLLNGLE